MFFVSSNRIGNVCEESRMTEDEIEKRLVSALNPAEISIRNESHLHAGHAGATPEGNTHFRVRIVAAAFEGLSRIERHRLVNEALQDLMNNPIHALALKTLAPDEADAA